jgi:hypothetical protein
MLDDLINGLSQEKGAELASLGIPAEKTGDLMNILKGGLTDQFKLGAETDSLGNLLNLFNGKESIASSPLVDNLVGSFATQIAPKLGVSPLVAQGAAKMMVPSLLSKLNDATPATGLSPDNITELMGGAGGIEGMVDKVKDMFT